MPEFPILRGALAATALICLAAGAAAQMPGQTPGMPPPGMPGPIPGQPQTVLLTDAMVEGFIQSYPVIEAEVDALEQQYDLPDDGSPMSAMQGLAAYQEVSGRLNAVVSPYGFDSYGHWVTSAMSIAMAHAFAREGGAMDSQMAEALARVQNDPNIPAGQKQMIIQQMQAQSQMMAGMRPPQRNIDVVNRYAAELATLFDEN